MIPASGPKLIDPRDGDIEDDASSTKARSLLSLAGNLLVEISLPRLLIAWMLLLVIPGLLLGAAPIAVAIWVSTVAGKIGSATVGLWSALLIGGLAALGWFGWRPLLRTAERSFWSLNALLVQPIYAAFREGLRHLAEQRLAADAPPSVRARLRSACAAMSGLIQSGLAVLAIWWVWPHTHLVSGIPQAGSVRDIAVVVLANSVALVSGYVAIAAIVWAVADATMPQPADLAGFAAPPAHGRTWRVVHLSDIHVVGERYGFRIESGRSGPQGNARWGRILAQLADIHARRKLDVILVTGDMTDAGRCAEWAEFADALAAFPQLAALTLTLPGNHDVNIVDRANPARLDLPTSPNRRLRLARALSAMAALHGDRVRVIDPQGQVGATLTEAMASHWPTVAKFMSTGMPRMTRALPELWDGVFPMVVPPEAHAGLGIILLNSNAITHFSFTNALGMVSAQQARGIDAAMARYPQAFWIIALHHHVVEYPRPAKALSERIGTALINGNWFVRRLLPHADRLVVMHGHRHIDWIGTCANLIVVSAPSPVMEAGNGATTYFYVHTLAGGEDGRIRLLAPERIDVAPA